MSRTKFGNLILLRAFAAWASNAAMRQADIEPTAASEGERRDLLLNSEEECVVAKARSILNLVGENERTTSSE